MEDTAEAAAEQSGRLIGPATGTFEGVRQGLDERSDLVNNGYCPSVWLLESLRTMVEGLTMILFLRRTPCNVQRGRKGSLEA